MYTQLSLWQDKNEKNINQHLKLPLPNADIIFYSNFLDRMESDPLFSDLYNITPWKQESTKLFGKNIQLPRLTAWYGDKGKFYCYSKIKMEPLLWNETLIKIKTQVDTLANTSFNSVLLNLYRDGRDSISWHSDDEPELGKKPVIASVSFGSTRRFLLRYKTNKELKYEIELTHGSLLLMLGTTQHYWQHQIPKTNKLMQPRINLTFRKII